MSDSRRLLCPVDFSSTSRGAFHYASAIARRFDATLTLLAVDDPLMTAVTDARMWKGWSNARTADELRSFARAAVETVQSPDLRYEVRNGNAAPAIVALARIGGFDLIVMGSHGRTGIQRAVLGTVAERVLRETDTPVLLVPNDPGPLSFDELARLASPMLVPVDFGPGTSRQVNLAAAIAKELRLSLLIGHVLEPIDWPPQIEIDRADLNSERDRRACSGLRSLACTTALDQQPQTLLACGDPSTEIAKWVREWHAGSLVMALHSDPDHGRRMGSVTYKTIASTHLLTLAVPPQG